jgi:DNA mismatch repair protein MutS
MAGIPHHAAERYCSELIRRGLSVALCDQLEAAPASGSAKGTLLRRDITRVLTPGTVLEEGLLSARRNNWLAAVVVKPAQGRQPFRWGLACADVSTGEFLVREQDNSAALHQELARIDPAELIHHSQNSNAPNWCPERLQRCDIGNTAFSQPEAEALLLERFRLQTLDGLGLQNVPLAMRAAGGLLAYLSETCPLDDDGITPPPLERPITCFPGDALVLDAQTRRNLELTATQRDNQFQGSLLWAIDRTLTAMGARCLRRWIEAPLMDPSSIRTRQVSVSQLVSQRPLRQALRRLLRPMGDLERLAGRAGAGHAGARDLVAIADGLGRLPQLANLIASQLDSGPSWLSDVLEPDPALAALGASIRHQLVESPPLSLSEGGLIHDGVDPLLDGLRNQLDDQEKWLAQQEQLERQRSNNSNLKLQYHRTFGYFLSVSRARSGAVPDHWIRRQTLANEERFITPDLKAREGQIFQMRARAAQREYELFCALRTEIGDHAEAIRRAARAIAGLDALTSLAEAAATGGWCAPEITADRSLVIEQGRHPVVEQLLVEDVFIPNDSDLGTGIDLVVLTGPNASGKSCYLRQIGLIQLLAQIGSWVPAQTARIGIADRIFTRVGAVDDLAAGQSTFMVEMAETANILHHASDRSLVLLDEIGRGTATFDGLSIAWAVSEHLAGDLQARTVFATHYHELNALAGERTNVANCQVLVEETGDDLVFLHRVAAGGASRSYGIEAARLAGVPASVVQRARQVLDQLAT